MNPAKIRLSQKEMELVTNTDLILTKNAILQKIKLLLADLQVQQQQCLQSYSGRIPDEIIQSSPKISKGENYNGLPYLMLDYPRVFNSSAIYAIRTMFWWGNFFSITLHLSGQYKKNNEEKLVTSFQSLLEKGFYYCMNDDEWEHHFEITNYAPLASINKNDFAEAIRKKSFVKLANKISLKQWDTAEETVLTFFKQITKMLAD